MKFRVFQLIAAFMAVILLQGCAVSMPRLPWIGERPETVDPQQEPGHVESDEPAEDGALPQQEDPERAVYRLRPNDPLSVRLRGIPVEQNFDETVDENGYIQLPYLDSIRAAGKSASQLERTIRQAYLDARIYRDSLTVSVMVPTQNYFMRGEVRSPGRYPLTGGVTLLQAIATAGGYTQFASPRRVQLYRGDEVIRLNVNQIEKNPETDRLLHPGDVIVVPRSIF